MKKPFEDMVKEHTGWLYAFIKRRMSNSAISEDILQEVWFRAYRAYGDYVDCGKPRAWLGCIAQNHIASYYKQNRDRYIFSLDGGEEDESFYGFLPGDSSPEEEIVKKEQIDRMLAFLGGLPEGQKNVLAYRYLYGMSVKETAERMSIPEGSVKSKMHDVMLYSNNDPCTKVERSIDAPNLYYGERVNWFGCDVKSALYQAVPAEATNIRIKRGNGVLVCGSYYFPYADRYLTEDEGHHLKYSYNL